MLRLLKRRGTFPCRGTFILVFTVILVISLVMLIESTLNERSFLTRNEDSFQIEKHDRKEDTVNACGSGKCITKEECNNKKSFEDLEDISCRINQDVKKNIGLSKYQGAKHQITNITCKLNTSDKEVYVPFSFIKLYFDVYGELRASASDHKLKNKWFSWSHSYSRVFQQLKNEKYRPDGIFESLYAKPVENRDRVKCIDAKYGVPVSSQWKKEGHYYPTQISQFGLSYWSKQVLLEKKMRQSKREDVELGSTNLNGFQSRILESPSVSKTIYENGLDIQSDDWQGASMTRVIRDSCVHFESEITLPLNNDIGQQILSFDLKFGDNVTISVSVKFPITGDRFIIKYVPVDNLFVYQRGNVIFFGYGVVHVGKGTTLTKTDHDNTINTSKQIRENSWHRFTRILSNDLMKGMSKKVFEKLYKQNNQNLEVEKVTFEGRDGCVTNLTLSVTEHLRMFFHAADWLIDNQDNLSGGWPIQVPFNEKQEKYPKAKEISPGWYSAMSQGHALSVLSRAYIQTKNEKYLRAAIKGLQLFKNPLFDDKDKENDEVSSDNIVRQQIGVSSMFLNQFVWFQEYPTEPNTFVLNGFMYSLIGLYDLWHTTKYSLSEESKNEEVRYEGLEAGDLFLRGLKSLNTMIPLYDVASGSVYDLRHVTMPGVEPKVSRWDYHSVHINLLYLLSTIDVPVVKSDLKHSVKKNIPVMEEESVLLSIAERWLGYMLGKRAGHN